jgi:ATPase subunit of ABC transporter with duplicated ATPase domains
VLAATLSSGCHVVLEGPPGTGKSTLLRAVADGAGLGVEFVEGNAELTPARLVGHHDHGAERPGARTSTSVIAFAADALVLQRQGETRSPAKLVDDLLSLRGKGRTDLALALRTASRELAREPAAERVAIVLSDCRVTAGGDPLGALGGLDRVDVLGTDDDPDAIAAGKRLASHARGRYLPATRFRDLQTSLVALLA